jgi:hypothetical protein
MMVDSFSCAVGAAYTFQQQQRKNPAASASRLVQRTTTSTTVECQMNRATAPRINRAVQKGLAARR